MERDLQRQLDNRSWLRRDAESIENQWRSQVLPHFERTVKFGFDITEGLEGSEHFALYGLKADAGKKFPKDKIEVSRHPIAFETLVARGAVYRSINKSQGPSRRTAANIGILQTEVYNPVDFQGHRDAEPSRPSVDGQEYVEDTAQWIIKKGVIMHWNQSHKEANYRNFSIHDRWVIKQDVYYNQILDKAKDHFPVEHPQNQG
ncbi:hypothetical protein NUU61_003800 [Penicillium alfredii]|uniref:Uncharacterized protein n=1 Tax=Penicillium alfredii TaxID=1506179 RepID=A0A9W9KDB7_9EURO|nr:uncharacterized protein NUU61_003800 [Penicillium alfredii]KAJ5101578.1 hypothetical protein NUU61_003800 [Penicillium alfredii]